MLPAIASRSDLEDGKYLGEGFINPNAAGGSSQMLSPKGLQQLSDELEFRLALNEGRQGPPPLSRAASSVGLPANSSTPSSPPSDPLVRALLDLITVLVEGPWSGAHMDSFNRVFSLMYDNFLLVRDVEVC